MRIQIIGCGMVGSSIANELINTARASKLLLVDKDYERARGEYLDLDRVKFLKNLHVEMAYSRLQASRGYDVTIIALGARCDYRSYTTRERAVEQLYKLNLPMVREAVQRIKEGRIIIVTNPADRIAKDLRGEFYDKKIVHAGDLIDEIHDGRAIQLLKGFTNWGIAAEVGGML